MKTQTIRINFLVLNFYVLCRVNSLNSENFYKILWNNHYKTITQGDKIKKFTYRSCSIINIGINTHEIH